MSTATSGGQAHTSGVLPETAVIVPVRLTKTMRLWIPSDVNADCAVQDFWCRPPSVLHIFPFFTSRSRDPIPQVFGREYRTPFMTHSDTMMRGPIRPIAAEEPRAFCPSAACSLQVRKFSKLFFESCRLSSLLGDDLFFVFWFLVFQKQDLTVHPSSMAHQRSSLRFVGV